MKRIKLSCWVTCILSLNLIACSNSMQEVRSLGTPEVGIDKGVDITLYLSSNASIRAKLTAPIMQRHYTDDNKITFPKRLHIDCYDSLGKISTQITAKYGAYLQNKKQATLRDSVVVFNVQGDTLWTNELFWNQSQQSIFTDKYVVIQRKNMRSIGTKGMHATQDLHDITIFGIEQSNGGNRSWIKVKDTAKTTQ